MPPGEPASPHQATAGSLWTAVTLLVLGFAALVLAEASVAWAGRVADGAVALLAGALLPAVGTLHRLASRGARRTSLLVLLLGAGSLATVMVVQLALALGLAQASDALLLLGVGLAGVGSWFVLAHGLALRAQALPPALAVLGIVAGVGLVGSVAAVPLGWPAVVTLGGAVAAVLAFLLWAGWFAQLLAVNRWWGAHDPEAHLAPQLR